MKEKQYWLMEWNGMTIGALLKIYAPVIMIMKVIIHMQQKKYVIIMVHKQNTHLIINIHPTGYLEN